MKPSARTLANRRNALLSTGPKTQAGKARASRNAIKHGLSSRLEADRLTPKRDRREPPMSEEERIEARNLAAAQARYARVIGQKDILLAQLAAGCDMRPLERLQRYERAAAAQVRKGVYAFDAACMKANGSRRGEDQ